MIVSVVIVSVLVRSGGRGAGMDMVSGRDGRWMRPYLDASTAHAPFHKQPRVRSHNCSSKGASTKSGFGIDKDNHLPTPPNIVPAPHRVTIIAGR